MWEAPSSLPFRIWVQGKEGVVYIIRGKRRSQIECPQGVGKCDQMFSLLSSGVWGPEKKREEEYRQPGHLTYMAVTKGEGTAPQGLCVRRSAIPICSLPSPPLPLKNKTHAHSHKLLKIKNNGHKTDAIQVQTNKITLFNS